MLFVTINITTTGQMAEPAEKAQGEVILPVYEKAHTGNLTKNQVLEIYRSGEGSLVPVKHLRQIDEYRLLMVSASFEEATGLPLVVDGINLNNPNLFTVGEYSGSLWSYGFNKKEKSWKYFQRSLYVDGEMGYVLEREKVLFLEMGLLFPDVPEMVGVRFPWYSTGCANPLFPLREAIEFAPTPENVFVQKRTTPQTVPVEGTGWVVYETHNHYYQQMVQPAPPAFQFGWGVHVGWFYGFNPWGCWNCNQWYAWRPAGVAFCNQPGWGGGSHGGNTINIVNEGDNITIVNENINNNEVVVDVVVTEPTPDTGGGPVLPPNDGGGPVLPPNDPGNPDVDNNPGGGPVLPPNDGGGRSSSISFSDLAGEENVYQRSPSGFGFGESQVVAQAQPARENATVARPQPTYSRPAQAQPARGTGNGVSTSQPTYRPQAGASPSRGNAQAQNYTPSRNNNSNGLNSSRLGGNGFSSSSPSRQSGGGGNVSNSFSGASPMSSPRSFGGGGFSGGGSGGGMGGGGRR